MKKTMAVWLAACMLLMSLCACAVDDKTAAQSVLKSYFAAYETADYEAMKPYCTEAFVQQFFHEGDVFGSATAKLLSVSDREIDTGDEGTVAFECRLSVKPVEGAADYNEKEPVQETYVVYLLERQPDHTWRIAGLRTDL